MDFKDPKSTNWTSPLTEKNEMNTSLWLCYSARPLREFLLATHESVS